jgi:hypothetical protein
MKYVIISESGLELPIILTECQSHKDVVKEHTKVISAGFCKFYIGDNDVLCVCCWGKSVGLNVASRLAVDEEIILKQNSFS